MRRRPRIVLSLGLGLSVIAILGFVLVFQLARYELGMYGEETGKVVAITASEDSAGGSSVFVTRARVQIGAGDDQRLAHTQLWTRNPRERDAFLRRYATGTEHPFRFLKSAPDFVWPADGPGRKLVYSAAGVEGVFLALVGALVYVGKKRNI